MAEHLEKLQKREKKAARISGISLGVAMLTMALWGWTPLKTMIPALVILTVFVSFVILSMGASIFTIYQGIQVRALTAKIADED